MHLEDMQLVTKSNQLRKKGQLEASEPSIKYLFNNLLDETNGFKYQKRLKVILKKYKPNGETEFRAVYFNSTIKMVTNHKSSLENAFQEIFYMIDNCISKGSVQIVELMETQYINISLYVLAMPRTSFRVHPHSIVA